MTALRPCTTRRTRGWRAHVAHAPTAKKVRARSSSVLQRSSRAGRGRAQPPHQRRSVERGRQVRQSTDRKTDGTRRGMPDPSPPGRASSGGGTATTRKRCRAAPPGTRSRPPFRGPTPWADPPEWAGRHGPAMVQVDQHLGNFVGVRRRISTHGSSFGVGRPQCAHDVRRRTPTGQAEFGARCGSCACSSERHWSALSPNDAPIRHGATKPAKWL